MQMLKLASRYQTKLAQAFSKTYKDLLGLNDSAQALAMDIYQEQDKDVLAGLKEIAKWVGTASDKAYREGLQAATLKYFLDKAKLKATLLMSLKLDPETAQKLSALAGKLSAIQPMDIPAQMPAPAAEGSAYKMDNRSVPEGQEKTKSDYDAVVKGLARKDFPQDSDSFGPEGQLRVQSPAAPGSLLNQSPALPHDPAHVPTQDELDSVVNQQVEKDYPYEGLHFGPQGRLVHR